MSSVILFAELPRITCTRFRPRVTSDFERVCHAMASRVMMTFVLLVISELTKQESVTILTSVRSVLQVLHTRKSRLRQEYIYNKLKQKQQQQQKMINLHAYVTSSDHAGDGAPAARRIAKQNNGTTCMYKNRRTCNSLFMVNMASGMDRGRVHPTTTTTGRRRNTTTTSRNMASIYSDS